MRPSPSPDFGRLRQVLLRQGEPDRVPFIELFADAEIMAAVIGEPVPSPLKADRGRRSPGAAPCTQLTAAGCGHDSNVPEVLPATIQTGVAGARLCRG